MSHQYLGKIRWHLTVAGGRGYPHFGRPHRCVSVGENNAPLVRELKLQNQRDFKLRLEHDRRHEFKAAKICFYSALHLNGVHPSHPPGSSERVPDRAGGVNLLHSVEISCIKF